MTRYQEGLEGENLAADYLKRRGFTLIARRYRSRAGEVDLIARQGRMLYFVEVKYRPQGRLGTGLRAVTPDKRRRLKLTARHYLATQPSPYQVSCLEITRAGVWFYPDIMHEI
ncbi:MAG: YraN family protein [Eubacteriales bacterium]|nr:YraN family protein [Eubacteriales bacterium]